MAFIGNAPASVATNFQGVVSDSFNGTGSQTDFTLTRSVASVAWIEVLVDNVQQSPYDGSYSVTGTTLSFSGAPPSGTNNVYVVYRDQPLASIIDSTAYRQTEVDTLLDAKVSKAGDTMTGALSVTNSSTTTPAGYFQNTSGSGDSPALIVRGGANNTNTVGTFEVQSYGGNKHLKVDGNGRVTMPYQPCFYASQGSQINSGSQQTIPFGEIAVNIGGHYSAATNRFTAPIAGRYRFGFVAMSYGADANRYGLLRNGSLYSNQRYAASQIYENFSGDWIISMAANDYVEIVTGILGNASVHPDYRSFSGYLIG